MQIIWRESSDSQIYNAACVDNVFNECRPSRFPLAVIKAASNEDVVAAMNFARDRNCKITARAGGHSFDVWSLQDNSILVDLQDWKEIKLNTDSQTAEITPGVTSQELHDYLKPHGLMFPVGHCPGVGMGGFLLQGGMGWNSENLGWASEHVTAVDVVTSQGNLIHCDKVQNSDLYWAARGAGPAFPALVTRFYINTAPHPKGIHASGYIYPRHLYKQAFKWALDLQPHLDSETTMTAVAQYHKNKLCFGIFFTSWKNSLEDAKSALQPLHDTRPAGTLVHWFCKPDSIDKLFKMQDIAMPKGLRYRIDDSFLRNGTDVSAVLEEAFLTLPHPKSIAFWSSMRPASRRGPPDMALSVHSDHYFALYAMCEHETEDEQCQTWLQRVMEPILPHTVGTYLGETSFQLRRGQYWSDENTRRLMEICRKWDPEGRVFGGYSEVDEKVRAANL